MAVALKPSLRNLQEELFHIKEKCQDIGIRLELDDEFLEKIERSFPADFSTQLRHILRLWLEREDASWHRLIKALEHPIIGEAALATTLKTKYSPSPQKSRASTPAPPSSSSSVVHVDLLQNSVTVEVGASTSVPAKNSLEPTNNTPETVDEQTSYRVTDFSQAPPKDRICPGCGRVPKKAFRSECCQKVYCTICSNDLASKMSHCSVHKMPLVFVCDKVLTKRISENTLICSKCKVWKGKARNYYKHLLACQGYAGTQVHSSSSDQTVSRVPPPSDQGPSSSRKRLYEDYDGTAAGNGRLRKVLCVGESGVRADSKKTDPSVPNSCEFEEPTSFGDEDLDRTPDLDQKCSSCQRVPRKAKKSKCCGIVYCEPCASKTKTCPSHGESLVLHPELNTKLASLIVRCKNRGKGCVWRKPVNQLRGHLVIHCRIHCPYSSLGCKEHVTNASFIEHMSKCTVEHLDLVRQVSSRLESEVSRLCIPPQLFMICSVSKHKSVESGWVSRSFYAHQLGCKLHLVIWFSSSTNVLNVKVIHDEGLHDNTLQWPCKGRITLEIVNQAVDSSHAHKVLNFNLDQTADSFSNHYILLAAEHKNTVLDDRMYVRVLRVNIDTQLPWL